MYLDLRLRAKTNFVDYIEANLKDAMLCQGRKPLIELCMKREKEAGLNGLILEFGVAGGVSTRIIAKNAEPRTVHGFDSFEGLPGDWSGTHEQKGRYTQHGKLPRVPANVKLHKGWFDQTLPGFLASNPGPVSFINVDCDVYELDQVCAGAAWPTASGRVRSSCSTNTTTTRTGASTNTRRGRNS